MHQLKTIAELRSRCCDERLRLIADIVRQERGLITEKWARKAEAEFEWADECSRSELLDHLPELLSEVGSDIADWQGEIDRSNVRQLATLHGRHRWEQGWKLDQLIRDYQLLRLVLVEHISGRLQDQHAVPVTRYEGQLIHKTIDEAIVASGETFMKTVRTKLETANQLLDRRVQERTQQINMLSRRLTEAEAGERARVADLLHENVQQTLFAARLKLSSLLSLGDGGANQRDDGEEATNGSTTENGSTTKNGSARENGETAGPAAAAFSPNREFLERLQVVHELLSEAVETTRTLASDLAPPVLREKGFLASLDWLAERAHDRFGIAVEVEVESGDPRLRADLTHGSASDATNGATNSATNGRGPSNGRTNGRTNGTATGRSGRQPVSPDDLLGALTDTERTYLFRFIQEAILNAAKHSGSRKAVVRVTLEPQTLGVKVIDSGSLGRKLQAAFQSGNLGYGLASLARQAELLGGSFSVCTDRRHDGACVSVQLPLDEHATLDDASAVTSS